MITVKSELLQKEQNISSAYADCFVKNFNKPMCETCTGKLDCMHIAEKHASKMAASTIDILTEDDFIKMTHNTNYQYELKNPLDVNDAITRGSESFVTRSSLKARLIELKEENTLDKITLMTELCEDDQFYYSQGVHVINAIGYYILHGKYKFAEHNIDL